MQAYGLEMLMHADTVAEAEQAQQLRTLAAPSQAAYGDGEEIPAEDSDPAEDAERDFDYSEVDWAPDASADEWTRMQQALEASRVTVAPDAEAPESDVPPPPHVDFDADFDREWT